MPTLTARELSIKHLHELWKKEFGNPFNYAFNHIIDWCVSEADNELRIYICRVTEPSKPSSIETLTKEECETIMRLLRQIINGDYTE